MTGKQLLEKYLDAGGEYGRLLMTIMYNIGPEIEPLLEKAEKSGKRLALTPEPQGRQRDELTVKDIIFE